MALEIVLKVLKNKEMSIIVLDHVKPSYLLCIYKVSNDEKKFNIENHIVTESVSETYKNQVLSLTNQIRRIRWDFHDEGHSFNNKFGNEYSSLLSNIFPNLNFFETKKN